MLFNFVLTLFLTSTKLFKYYKLFW